MADLSAHFGRHEFACQCGCGFDTVDAELVSVLERMRLELRASEVVVTSGCRCVRHNLSVGGAEKSLHRSGKAADVKVGGVGPDAVADYFEAVYPDKYGIGRYHGRTHIDVRPDPARWDKRS